MLESACTNGAPRKGTSLITKSYNVSEESILRNHKPGRILLHKERKLLQQKQSLYRDGRELEVGDNWPWMQKPSVREV